MFFFLDETGSACVEKLKEKYIKLACVVQTVQRE